MNKVELELLYKNDTGERPVYHEETELEIWRSKGQWILNIDDQEAWEMGGLFRFDRPDPDYVEWLENKLMELL